MDSRCRGSGCKRSLDLEVHVYSFSTYYCFNSQCNSNYLLKYEGVTGITVSIYSVIPSCKVFLVDQTLFR